MSDSVSPIPYTGNKNCIQDTILSVMPPHKTYLEACASITDLLPDVSWKRTDPDTGTISFQTTITDRQSLQCELTVRWPSTADDTLYEVTRQQTVNTSDWTPDTSQKLYQPK